MPWNRPQGGLKPLPWHPPNHKLSLKPFVDNIRHSQVKASINTNAIITALIADDLKKPTGAPFTRRYLLRAGSIRREVAATIKEECPSLN